MRYFVEPNAPAGTVGGNTWASAGELVATVAAVIAAPSPGGDEIWCLQGNYNLAGNPLNIINTAMRNIEPLSIYGCFAGWENTLCDRNANINSLQYPTFFQHPSILDGGGVNRIINMDNVSVYRIDGFIIQNGNEASDGGGVQVVSSSNIWFENIVFMDNVAGGNGGGLYARSVRSLMIKNSIFFHNTANGAIGGGGIYANSGGVNTLLINLLFNENQAANGNGDAIYLNNNVDNVKIINNTIVDNTTSNSSVYCMGSNQNVGIYNSIFYPDILDNSSTSPSNIIVDYCLLNQTNFPSINNIYPTPASPVNPYFVNQASLASGGDYHLQINPPFPNTSPCIDSGYMGHFFPFSDTDLEGNPRFIDNGVNPPPPLFRMIDRGAFEVQ